MRIAIEVAPNSLSPLLATDTTENMLGRLVFDTLTSVDEHGRPVPILATVVPSQANGGISSDGLTVTYHLRRGVRWHDGAPFTSADVAFTYAAIMNPRNNVGTRYGFDVVRTVATPDAATVVFQLKHRFAPIVTTLFGESDNPQPILPAHLLSRYPDLNTVPLNTAPIGTGPFIFERWDRGDRIVYRANDAYFRGRPKLRRIIARLIPDENSEVLALRTHDVDWFFEASPQTYPALRALPDARILFTEKNATTSLYMNTAQPQLRDANVRRAIAAAIDKDEIVRKYTFGTAVAAAQDLPPWVLRPTSPVHGQAYDPALARRFLAGAGYVAGSDGIVRRDGARLALDLSYVQSNPTTHKIAVEVQSRLRSVGIEAQIRPYTGSQLFAPYGMGGILTRGRYDLNLSSWYSGVDPDDSSQFLCSAIPPQGSNYTRFCAPEMEAAQHQALTQYDHALRRSAYTTVERILANDIPQVVLFYPRGIDAFNPDFSGFAPNPVTESWNAFQWTIFSETNRRSPASPN